MSRCYDYKNNLQTPNLKSTNAKRATRWRGGGGLGREVGRGATSTAAGSHKLMKFYLLMQWGKLHRSAVPTLAGNNESVSCLKALGYCPSHARWKNSISSQSAVVSVHAVPHCSPVSPTVCPGMEVGKQVASAIKSSSCNYCHKNEQNAARRARHKKMWPRMNVMLPLPPLQPLPGGAG